MPAEILQKRGRPTAEEWTALRGHPAASAAYLAGLSEWLGEWARAASEHHERIDGTGYPLGLRGDEISLAGRIVSVADAFDVMTSARSYKKPHPAARARAELTENAGTQFDREVVRAFLSVSLRDLSLVMGPLAILTQLPALAQVPLEAATVAVAPAVAGVAATALAFAAPGHAVTRHHSSARSVAGPVASGGSASPAAPAHPGASHARGVTPTRVVTTTPARGTRHVTATTVPGARPTPTPTPTTTPSRGGGGSPTTAPTTTPTTRPPTTTTTLAPVNHPPVANPDTPNGKITSPSGSVDVLANDTDPDGNLSPSTLRIVTPPKGTPVTISIVAAQVHYDAPAGYRGNVAFKYQVCDTDGACASAEVTLSFKVS